MVKVCLKRDLDHKNSWVMLEKVNLMKEKKILKILLKIKPIVEQLSFLAF